MSKRKKQPGPGVIAVNRRARFDFNLEQRYECGIELEGWEVKSLREGKAQLVDSYVLVKDGQAWLLGAHITPLSSASSHLECDPKRSRRLLLHKKEIMQIMGATQRKGYTCVATSLYWKANRVKCEVALARGKKVHDKRTSEKERDWQREKARVMKEMA